MFKSYVHEDVKVQKVKKIWKLKFPNEVYKHIEAKQ